MFISIDNCTFINPNHIIKIEKYKRVGADMPYRLRLLLSTGEKEEFCFADSSTGRADWLNIFEEVIKSS